VSRFHPVRAAVALFLAVGLVALLGTPLCFSAACPMSAADRPACKAMGGECCGNRSGQLSHAPAAPAPPLVAPALPRVVPPAAVSPAALDLGPAALPAIVQGIGLFTLFAVFLI
jgi:hypothetical protein